ncbi:tRNA lysidine(34) synthetase TilS [Oceanobacillus senegalensis]|uniref:tRNA lysidine(34) synthetase TilS n=1 Tax=Oceanobacillus senegalensis TaxID=1936063 RepID=UPI000A3049E8|nr:tRNA lysidine(34) synthetase TilS [Oceanobacillus senegalensis]
MKQTILSFIDKHQLIKNGSTVLVGASGGADSMALLHFLYRNQMKWNIHIIAVSVDHQLRGEASREDIVYVDTVCKEWGIPFVWERVNVIKYQKEKGISTELAARELRYQYFEKVMKEYHADYLALGHHGDDQVETMLMSLTRSASTTAFSGIPVRRKFSNGYIIRPLLCVTKAEIHTYCRENEISPRIDETNFDTLYTRNFFRKHVVPLIKQKNSNIHTTIQHLSETRNEDEYFLQEKAKEMVEEVVKFDDKWNSAILEVDAFKKRAHALQRRALHLILNYLYKELPKDLSYVHEEQFLSLLDSKEGNRQLYFPSQLKVERAYEEITFRFYDSGEDTSYHFPLEVPGEVLFPDGSKVLAQFSDVRYNQDTISYGFYENQVSFPLHIRTRKSGDRMSWYGLNGSKKLKDIFIDEKIPLDKRNSWPILVDNNGEIIWLIGLKKGKLKDSQDKGRWIQLNYVQATSRRI